jgi:choline dehydrogenase-like flavoprotein
MELDARQERALAAICDTFAPSASELGVPAALVETLGRHLSASEARQLGRLLGLWDTRLVTALGGGGPRRFSELGAERREAVLRSWCDSRLTARRAAFQALRKAVLFHYYMLPSTPVWERIGYPGPLGPPAEPAPRALTPLPVESDTTLDCDVCVVGSGAGGGTAAGVLAAAGLDVVVLEAGGYYDDADFDGGELAGYDRLYLRGGTAATPDQSMGLLAGCCLGGGTTINYTTSFRTPDDVREEWAGHGVAAFATDEFTRSLDAVCKRLGVNLEHSVPSARDELMRRGLTALGWHVDSMPRNARGCDRVECGWCGYGCRRGAKQSTVKTWLADAQAAGARILVRTRAGRVLVSGGRATGVEARTAEGRRVTVRARAVVAACGALQTPALLRRSGLGSTSIGRNLRLHPATAVFGMFEEEVRPWEGTMQALYSDEHRDLDDGYGLKYETAAVHPSLAVAFLPWRGALEHAELMESLPRSTGIGVLLRDRDGGEVRVGRDGEPVASYRLSDFDRRHVRTGVDGAAQILEAAGARQIFSAHTRRVGYEPGREGSRERFLRDGDACGWDAGRCVFYSFHIMGTARMGGSPAESAADPTGETWEVRDLLVCDGSTFPTASGVNPMVSIEAIAHMNASALAARLA